MIEKLKKDTNDVIAPMMNEINNCSAKLKELTDKQTALQLMLHAVETEINALNSRKKTLDSSVQESQSTFERTVLTVGNTPNNMEAIMATKIQDKVSNLTLNIHEIEDCFALSYEEKKLKDIETVKSMQNGKDRNNGNKSKVVLTVSEPVRVEKSMATLSEYVKTECQCLSLLSGRVGSLSSQLINLKREYNAYKSLNMSALVSDVHAAITKVEGDILEDKKAILCLQGELVELLERFCVCLNIDAKGKGSVFGEYIGCLL